MRSSQIERMRSLSDLPKLHEFERAMQMEVTQADGREEMFLRSSSGLSALFKTLGLEHARPYLRYALRDVFGEKSVLYRCATTTPAQVRAYAQSVIERLIKALSCAPVVLRAACYFVLREFRKAFPNSRQATTIVVGGVLFLRLVCPSLIKPEIIGFQPHNARSLPVCVQIAKMLQHTLSGNLLNENHPECALGNVFVMKYQPQVANLLERFTHVRLAQQPPQSQPSLPSQQQSLSQSPSQQQQQQSQSQSQSLSQPSESPCPAEVLCVKPWDAESSPPTPTNSWDVHPSKLRGMSMSTDEAGKRKRKFSFRFWSRMPASSMSS